MNIKQTNVSRFILNSAAIFFISILYSISALAGSNVKQSNVKQVVPLVNNSDIQAQWDKSNSRVAGTGVVRKDRRVNRFIIKYRAGINKSTRASLASKYSLQTIKQYKSLPNVDVVTIKNADPSSLLKMIKLDPDVVYVERDQVIQLRGMPNDIKINELWAINNGSDTDINAPEAWDITTGKRENVLAVLDTGVAYSHEDLSENMWRNPGEIPGNGIDDDGNGYVDDIFGIDAGDSDTDPYDDEIGHGTHVAGTIAATGNNAKGVSGVNQVASILACKMFGANLNSLESFVSVAIECIDYVWDLKVNHGVNIVASNASWGWSGKFSQAMYEALQKHRDAGILFVAAAGNSILNNDSLLDFPSSYDLSNIIAVSAQNMHEEQALFTNYGKHTVHVSAPGEHVLSTIPGSTLIPTVSADVFFDDLESGVTNWIADPAWGVTTDSYSGTVAWSDSPNGPYADSADTSLTSTVMDLSSYSGQTLSLGFFVKHQLEAGFDFLLVETSIDNGITWSAVGELTGDSAGWIFKSYVIPATAQLSFRFHLVADSILSFDGVTIDDISISSGTPPIVADNQYEYFSGTSMAAPHVVGALGLLKSQNVGRDWKQLKNLIIAGGVPFDTKSQPTMSNRRLRLVDVDGRGSMSCNNQTVQARLRPTQNVVDVFGDGEVSLDISYLNINCAQPAGDVVVTIRETGQLISLLDDGQGVDQVAGDGVYSSHAVLTNLGNTEATMEFPNGDEMDIRINPTYAVSTPLFEQIDLNTPEIIDIPVDGFSAITPPFPLQFGGESYDLAYVYQDGMLGFTLPRIVGIPFYENLQLPNRGFEALIAPFWSDLDADFGQIVSQTFGTAPNRQFVVEWQNVNAYLDSSQDGATFQLVFYENSSDIRVNYKDVTFGDAVTFNDGAEATVGLQLSSTLGMTYSFDTPAVTNLSSLLWKYIPVSPALNKAGVGGGNDDGGSGGLLWLTLSLLGFGWWRKQMRYN